MAKHATIDEYIAAIPEPLRGVATRARQVIDANLDDADSAIILGHPAWSIAKSPVCYLRAAPQHIVAGINQSQTSLDYPLGRLEGPRLPYAHELRREEDVDAELWATWLNNARQAVLSASYAHPINWWLGELQSAIDTRFAQELNAAGLSKMQWSVLSMVETHPSVADLRIAFDPWGRGDADDMPDVLSTLVERDWVESNKATFSLTDKGQALVRSVEARSVELRQALLAGISTEEYLETIYVLIRMVTNIQPDSR